MPIFLFCPTSNARRITAIRFKNNVVLFSCELVIKVQKLFTTNVKFRLLTMNAMHYHYFAGDIICIFKYSTRICFGLKNRRTIIHGWSEIISHHFVRQSRARIVVLNFPLNNVRNNVFKILLKICFYFTLFDFCFFIIIWINQSHQNGILLIKVIQFVPRRRCVRLRCVKGAVKRCQRCQESRQMAWQMVEESFCSARTGQAQVILWRMYNIMMYSSASPDEIMTPEILWNYGHRKKKKNKIFS